MSLLALEKLCGGFALTRPFSSVQLHFWQEISSEVTFFGQLGPAEVADILSGILAGGRRPLARSENQDEVAFRFHWAQSSMTHTGNRAFIRLKDFSHLVFLLGLEGDVSSLHQSILGPILVDACSFWKHFVLLVV